GNHPWMRTTLPGGSWHAPALLLDPILTLYEAYLDGHPIDRIGDVDGPWTEWHGMQWRMVPLPPTDEPRRLVLRIRSPYWMVGIRGRAFVGEIADHHRAIVRQDIGRFVVGALSVLAGLLFFLLAALRSEDRRPRAALALFALGAGGYSLFYTKLKDVVLDAPRLWSDVYGLSVHAMPIGIVMFVAHVFDAGPRNALRTLYRAQILVAAITVVMWFGLGGRSPLKLPITDLEVAAQVVVRVLALVATALVLYVVVRRARRGERQAQILLVGVVPLGLFTLRDLLAVAGIAPFAWDSHQYLGTLSLLGALAYVVQRRHDEEVRRYAAEKEHMLKDLHDGIGGITSNIGLLAEVAARAKEGRARELAADIAELSREGMAEMRHLLDSLDERELDWDRLAGQLRHIGNQSLTPHGLELSFEADIVSSSPPPTSLAYIHVVRVFREAIANVVKHAAAQRVQARFAITHDRLTLTVNDDGRGLSDDDPSGRGLANIRDRAAELGGVGELHEAPEGGVSVELNVPLPITPPMTGVPEAGQGR
ncbi:MAG: 7TM diverse intracellular signaling domain-containing protein, partial [Polyangiaceae bacterium]